VAENGGLTEPRSDASPRGGGFRFQRELTSLVAAPLLIWIIGWGPGWLLGALMALGAAAALWELLAMAEGKGLGVPKTLALALLAFLLLSFVLPLLPVTVAVFAVVLIIPAARIFSRRDLDSALPATAVSVLAILYVGLLAGAFIRLRLDFDTAGPKLIFFLLLTVWIGDAMAYYTGKNFGRTPLLPRVSPKKTVEGLAGGIAGSLITAAVIHFTFFPEFPLNHALAAAAILSLAGVVGDLVESAWKRSAGVKDSGSLIPGHGGFLDRLDSILFTAPVLYAYWYLLHYVNWYLLHEPFRL
jgi:phosphatidate cytidylyltransferase